MGGAGWLTPVMFLSKTVFGLINKGGKADPVRDPFTAPGTTAKADAAAAKTKAASQAKETILSRQRSISRNRSVFTNPLGLSGEASTIRKTLTGQ